MTKRCLNHAACLRKLQSCSWVTVLSINFHPQYGLLSYSEILCPHNPLTSTPQHSPKLCLLSSSLPLASHTSFCWSTRGAEGCQWRAESLHQMQPSPARKGRDWKDKRGSRDSQKFKDMHFLVIIKEPMKEVMVIPSVCKTALGAVIIMENKQTSSSSLPFQFQALSVCVMEEPVIWHFTCDVLIQ